MSTATPIGIDLGTTNSAVATVTGGEFEVLPNKRGDRTTPSTVAYDWDSHEVIAGRQAENQALANPESTIRSIKRQMGSDESVRLGRDTYLPEEISALIIQKLVRDAEETLGDSLSSAVITVPAYFNESQRQATKHAGEIAGLEVDRILAEPTAACLAYGLQETTSKTVLVYDLGGGTFDSSLVDIEDGVIDVRGTSGNTDLGGDDYDGLIVDWLLTHLREDLGREPTLKDPTLRARLFDAAKEAKHELTNRQTTTIRLPHLEVDAGDTVDLEVELTRDRFAELTSGPTQETIEIISGLLTEHGLSQADIDEVLMVGGATRIPSVKEAVQNWYGGDLLTGHSPDEIVALGAATQAAMLSDEPLPDPSSTSSLPAVASDGDALVQAGNQTVLLDALSETIGVGLVDRETREKYVSTLIERGETIPAKGTVKTAPIEDYQEGSRFEIYQGDGTLEGSILLDEFVLNHPPRKAEAHEQNVTMTVDEDGILHAEAVDEHTGTSAGTTVEAVQALTDGEVAEMRENLPTLRT